MRPISCTEGTNKQTLWYLVQTVITSIKWQIQIYLLKNGKKSTFNKDLKRMVNSSMPAKEFYIFFKHFSVVEVDVYWIYVEMFAIYLIITILIHLRSLFVTFTGRSCLSSGPHNFYIIRVCEFQWSCQALLGSCDLLHSLIWLTFNKPSKRNF